VHRMKCKNCGNDYWFPELCWPGYFDELCGIYLDHAHFTCSKCLEKVVTAGAVRAVIGKNILWEGPTDERH